MPQRIEVPRGKSQDSAAVFPSSPHIFLNKKESDKELFGRSPQNVNWACARCHTGHRSYFAGRMSTWNSTEYSDAVKGHCYSQAKARQHSMKSLTCIHCHQQYNSTDAIAAHTHHKVDSAGSRCMNYHMPKINEGMQDVVRTHLIFSPTEPKMLRSNQPNACNLCHVEKPIDRFAEWYNFKKSAVFEASVVANYPKRDEPVALGWLASDQHFTRLVAAEALTEAQARWAVPALIEALDDPHLETRQFTQKGLEAMLGRRLADLDYRFWMMKKEREARMRAELLKKSEAK